MSAARLAAGVDEWHRPVASGLVKLHVEIDCAATSRDGARLRLGAVGHGEIVEDVTPGPLPRRLWIAVHTHLLDDGEHPLALTLESRDGVTLASSTFALRVKNDSTLAARVRESLTRSRTPLFAGCLDARLYDFADEALRPWFDRPDADEHVARLLRAGEIDEPLAAALRQFVRDGYLEQEGLIDDARLDAVNREIDAAIAAGYQGYVPGSSQRLQHLHAGHPAIRALWLDERYLRLVDLIFGVPARPCQTLTYVFGSEQNPHQDTIHLTPFPAGYMCGAWIALEDVQPDSGELMIYPGSHRLPRLYMKDLGCAKVRDEAWLEFGNTVEPAWRRLLDEHSLAPVAYRPKRGTVLIWHENLMHGGGRRRNRSLSRRSIVIHSFADGAVVFYDSTGDVGVMAPRAWRTGCG
jgi:hypothetical protein